MSMNVMRAKTRPMSRSHGFFFAGRSGASGGSVCGRKASPSSAEFLRGFGDTVISIACRLSSRESDGAWVSDRDAHAPRAEELRVNGYERHYQRAGQHLHMWISKRVQPRPS